MGRFRVWSNWGIDSFSADLAVVVVGSFDLFGDFEVADDSLLRYLLSTWRPIRRSRRNGGRRRIDVGSDQSIAKSDEECGLPSSAR